MKFSVKAVTISSALVLALAGCSAAQSTSATSGSAANQQSTSQSAQATSATDSAAAQSTAPSQTAAPASKVQWTTVGSAEEAAKNAGLPKFGVIGTITLNGIEFKNPTFGASTGIAQAVYENGAASLIIRKATDAAAANVTDRAQSEFKEAWKKDYAELDETLWGPAKGAATVMTWKDGDATYGVTFQGLGGDELTMDSDECAIIVNSLKGANVPDPEPAAAPAAPAAQAGNNAGDNNSQANNEEARKATQDTEAPANSGYISNEEAKKKVTSQGNGTPDNVVAEFDDGVYFVTTTEDGIEYTYEVNAATGEVITHTASKNDDGSYTFTTMSEDGATEIIDSAVDGSTVSTTLVRSDDYGAVWLVTKRDPEGNLVSYYVTGEGAYQEANLDME